MKRTAILLFLLFTALQAGTAENVHVVINTGHSGPVHAVAFQKTYNLLFSCGDDGTVRAWDPESKKLVSLIQVSHHPIYKIALHPIKTQVAAVVRNGVDTYRLSVWDWKDQRELFSMDLKELPMYFEYSPKGTYIVYSRTNWQSLTFINSGTGTVLPYLQNGFGIVSSFIISPSETTIMTYISSGRLEYWRINEGTRKTWLEAPSNLKAISFTSNLRFMIGSDDNTLQLIDLLTGKPSGELELPDVAVTATNPKTNEIACIYKKDDTYKLCIVEFDSGTLVKRDIADLADFDPSAVIDFTGYRVYIPQKNGEIKSYSSLYPNDGTVFEKNLLAPISNISFHDTTMSFSTPDNLLFIDSDFFQSDSDNPASTYFHVNRFQSPLPGGGSHIDAFSDGTYMIWQAQPGKLGFVDSKTGEIIGKSIDFEFPIQTVDINDKNILVLESNGRCTLFDRFTLKKLYQYSAFGLQTAVLAGDKIVLGKSKSSGFNAPLLELNPATGETVPVFDSDIMIYAADYNPNEKKLYTLGIEEQNDETATTMKTFFGQSYGIIQTLFTYPGEDLSASIVVDPETDNVYTTVGFQGVKMFSKRSFGVFEQKEHISRKLYIYRDFLYAINKDHSITVWSTKTRRKVMDFYMFQDFNWIALLANGTYYASEGAEAYIGIYDNKGKALGNQDTFRLQ